MKSKLEILQLIDVGDPAAETDISTNSERYIPIDSYHQLINDRTDLFLAPKGMGKSALCTFFCNSKTITDEHRIVVIKSSPEKAAIELLNSPISRQLFLNFQMSEMRCFWRFVFLDALYRNFFCHLANSYKLEFLSKIPQGNLLKDSTQKNTLQEVLNFFRENFEEITKDGVVFLKLRDGAVHQNYSSFSDVFQWVNDHLKSKDIKLYIMCDQLDEVFERYSQHETKALRALMEDLIFFSKGFSNLKFKVFLRSDIFESITSSEYGALVNKDHLRREASFRMLDPQLIRLVLKRFLLNQSFADQYFPEIDPTSIEEIQDDICLDLLYRIIPRQSKKAGDMWEYIRRNLQDAHEMIYPRDLIALFRGAILVEQKLKTSDHFISRKSIEEALKTVSKDKLDTVIYAEFPPLEQPLEELRKGFRSYSRAELANKKINNHLDLCVKIGILKHIEGSDRFEIAHLFVPGLEAKGRRRKKRS